MKCVLPCCVRERSPDENPEEPFDISATSICDLAGFGVAKHRLRPCHPPYLDSWQLTTIRRAVHGPHACCSDCSDVARTSSENPRTKQPQAHQNGSQRYAGHSCHEAGFGLGRRPRVPFFRRRGCAGRLRVEPDQVGQHSGTKTYPQREKLERIMQSGTNYDHARRLRRPTLIRKLIRR
jgi:hypothetical protein